MLTAAIVVVILLTPSLMQGLFRIPAAAALGANSLATLALTIGCVVFGIAADRIGAARALAIGCALLAVSVLWLYLGVARDATHLPPLYALAGFCVGVVDRDKMIDGSKIKAGDVIFGLPSTGLHSNGFSLAR